MTGHPVFARFCDVLMRPLEKLREPVIREAHGAVLEIGFGTGLNLPYYRNITSLDAVEPDPYMCRRARQRIDAGSQSVTLHQVDAQALPFDDECFDSVVCTWTLCTIPDPEQALREVLRVLKPGGHLLYAEHTVSPHQPERLLQHMLNPVWHVCAAGCHLHRDTVQGIRDVGFGQVVDAPQGWQRLTLIPINIGRATKS